MELRQNTSIRVILGPFLDENDGNTPETVLVINASDVILTKHNSVAGAAKTEASACVHDSAGRYVCTFAAEDVDVLGMLRVDVHVSGALAVWQVFDVVSQVFWDAKYGSVSFATASSIAALNDLSEAQVNAQVDAALVDYGGPTNAEMNARTLPSANYATESSLVTIESNQENINTNVLQSITDIGNLENISVIDIIAGITDGAYDLQEILRAIVGAVAGPTDDGGLMQKSLDGSKDRAVWTITNNERTLVSRDLS